LVAVVGRCLVGCESGEQPYTVAGYDRSFSHKSVLKGHVLASYNAAPHNSYQPHPAEPEQYTTRSSTVFDLMKMGIMMPETC